MANPKTPLAQVATAPQSYVVCNHGSVAYKGACYMPGTTIPAGVLPLASAMQLLKDGRIRLSGAPASTPPPSGTAPARIGVSEKDFAGGKSSADVEPSGGSTAAAAAALAQLKATRGEAPTATAPVAPPAPPQPQTAQEAPASSGPWSHDPDFLVGKPIDELRQLARDIDPTVEVDHLDEVELVTLLSTDFTPVAQQG